MTDRNRRSVDSYFDFVAKRTRVTQRPAIPPYVPKPVTESRVYPGTPQPEPDPAPMQVEESTGTDGNDTIIARVKRFWSL